MGPVQRSISTLWHGRGKKRSWFSLNRSNWVWFTFDTWNRNTLSVVCFWRLHSKYYSMRSRMLPQWRRWWSYSRRIQIILNERPRRGCVNLSPPSRINCEDTNELYEADEEYSCTFSAELLLRSLCIILPLHICLRWLALGEFHCTE